MKKHVKSYTLYTMGLSGESLTMLTSNYGTEAELLDLAENISHLDNSNCSGVVWITLDSWLGLTAEDRALVSEMPKILVLPSDADINHLDDFGSLGFAAMLVEPLQPHKVREAMAKALETHNIYQDVYRMTREIMLERELLERKNANLHFLVSFLSNTSGLLLPDEILRVAKETLAELLPVNNLGAFIWLYDDKAYQGEKFIPCMFIPSEENTSDAAAWEFALIDAARSISKHEHGNYEIFSLNSEVCSSLDSDHSKDLSIALPLRIKDQAVGVVIISLAEDFPIGRDSLEVLESSMSHLALALRSTWLYKQVKTQSERDSLTGLHNRRYLDIRMQHEIRRHERYGNELGVIMLDIDHFKSINDEFGHLCGDDVLRDVGKILTEELRFADCIGRYGGEEFLVLLPYTSDEQAWVLAERLRHRIENHSFCGGKLGRKITASFGVTGFRPELGINACQLVNQADIALYRAKHQGRNCSVLEPIIPNLEIDNSKVQNLNA